MILNYELLKKSIKRSQAQNILKQKEDRKEDKECDKKITWPNHTFFSGLKLREDSYENWPLSQIAKDTYKKIAQTCKGKIRKSRPQQRQSQEGK